MKYDEPRDIDKPVFIVIVLLCVFLIAKILFWATIMTAIFGFGWYLKRRKSGDIKGPAWIIITSLILIPLTYFIGFEFEHIPFFNYVFNQLFASLS